MTCQITPEVLKAVIAFHGHNCPGLTIGVRAAEYALQLFSDTDKENLVCVTETDMCGVDGIQFLTGCTLGKGNLIHADYGKAAFSFFDRKRDKAVRLVLRPDAKLDENGGEVSREEMIGLLLDKPLTAVFDMEPLEQRPPRRARILQSLTCERCLEETMESRTRRFDGKTLCIPCFAQIEQKI